MCTAIKTNKNPNENPSVYVAIKLFFPRNLLLNVRNALHNVDNTVHELHVVPAWSSQILSFEDKTNALTSGDWYQSFIARQQSSLENGGRYLPKGSD